MEDPELLTLLAAEAERRGPMIITGIEELATSGEKNPARIEELRVEFFSPELASSSMPVMIVGLRRSASAASMLSSSVSPIVV